MSAQLPLALRWPAHQRFDEFRAGDNAIAFDVLRRVATETTPALAYVAGSAGSGKTHLLIATCAAASEAGRRAQYVPLAALRADVAAEAIRAFGGSDLLAIDDVDAIAANADAEHALFDLYNRCRADATTLLFAGSAPAAQLGIRLPDLVSRLSACTQLTLKPLDEPGRRELLRGRAALRGIELEDAAIDWLFAREKRDVASLLATLDRIDTASLVAQKRVTVPFLRALLG